MTRWATSCASRRSEASRLLLSFVGESVNRRDAVASAERQGIPKEKLMDAKIIFETSRMDRTKRKDILLSSFAKVAEQREDVFLFIGGGPAGNPIFKSLEELKSQLPSLDGRAFLLGDGRTDFGFAQLYELGAHPPAALGQIRCLNLHPGGGFISP